MSSLFEDLQTGLMEAIEITKQTKTDKKKIYRFKPVYEYSNKEIREIRLKLGMSQSVFAGYMGVSQKTIEAWENGRIHPTGPACRLLDIISNQKTNELLFLEMVDDSDN